MAVSKKQIYWYCQIIGWSLYILLNSIFLGVSKYTTPEDYLIYFLLLPAGILITHFYREVIIRLNLLNKNIPVQLAYMSLFSVIKALLYFMVALMMTMMFGFTAIELNLVNISTFVLNFTGVFLIWNFIYFGFHYFQNYKRAEINSLRYLAASHESELKNLRSQLNPHFIFNSLNSIRALVDENPDNARTAINRLSNILRSTLTLNNIKEIPLKDELNLVKDYLELEKVRYEERLTYNLDIHPDVMDSQIPPFILQTQVENAVKHGISRLSGNGVIEITVRPEGDDLLLVVSNPGKLNSNLPQTGVGFKNSAQRLSLLYGNRGRIEIKEENNVVKVSIHLPLISTAKL